MADIIEIETLLRRGSGQKFPAQHLFEKSLTKSLLKQRFRRLARALVGVYPEFLI